jgi:hypothetical protein
MTDVDTVLLGIFLVLCLTGYMSIILLGAMWYFEPASELSRKIFKWWFLPSQIVAILIAFYVMDVERNLIPIFGFTLLILANIYSGIIMLTGVTLMPRERTSSNKKILRLSSRIFCISLVCFVGWIIIWWKQLYA